MKRRKTASWRTKLLVLLLTFALAPAIAIAVIAFDTLEKTMQDSTLDGLQALARAKAEAVDQFMDNRRRDVERMSGLIGAEVATLQVAEAALAPVAPPPPPAEPLDDTMAIAPDGTPKPIEAVPEEPAEEPEQTAAAETPPIETAEARPNPRDEEAEAARAALTQKLGLLLWDQSSLEELIVIDPDGVVLASTFGAHTGKTAAALEYFDRGRRATYVQPVFLSPITNQLTMVIATPIRNASGVDIGVLAARLNLKRFFRLINDFTGLGKTGETVVGKKLGEEIVLMAPTRHDDSAALSRRIPLGSHMAEPLQDAARGQSGRGAALDYRGNTVFAAWQPAPSLEWGVVTKIDADEATAPLTAARNRIILLTLVIGLLVVIASLFASRALVKPLRTLKDAADRISKGNFDVELDIRSNDEIGELADSFERMTAAIKFFREHSRPAEDDEDPDPERASSPSE